ARALLSRMASDISRSLGPVDPVVVVTLNGTTQWTSTSTGTSGTVTAAGQAGGGQAAGAAGGAAATGGSGGGGGSGSCGATKNVPPANGAVSFNPGLQGDSDSVTICLARNLRDLGIASYLANGGAETNNGQVLTDLRQVTYRLGDGGQGLQRQETPL